MVTTDLMEAADPTDSEWWERAVIAAILQGYNDLPALKRLITRTDFASTFGGGLWDIIVRLDADGETPTMAAVIQRLGNHVHRLPGGPVYLSDLTYSSEIVPGQAEMYAHEIRKASLRRQVGQIGVRLVQSVQDLGTDPDDAIARNQDWLDKIRERQQLGSAYTKSALEMVIDTAEKGERGAPTTAWSDLDSLMGGYHRGAVTIVAGRPGTGKSLFGENAATDLVRRHGQHALLISLEMSEYELTQRTMSHTAKVLLSSLRAGRHHLTEKDWDGIRNAIPQMEEDRTRLTIQAGGGQTLLDIKAGIVQAHRRAQKAGTRLGLVVVDYIGRVRSTNGRLSRQDHLTEVIDGIKDVTQQYDTHSLVLAQLNRQSEGRADKRPQMSDLRDTGSLEQTGDNVILLHEDEIDTGGGRMQKSGEIDLILAKQRNGPTGHRTLQKMGEYAKLVQPEPLTPPTPLRAVRD